MPVLIRTQGLRRRSVDPRRVREAATRMLDALRLSKRELSILLCDDETIAELNRAYRGIDRPTDVLAFAMDESLDEELPGAPQGGSALLGDIAISIDRAREQAPQAGKTIAQEVIFLLAHGLLHLLGFDHATDEEERRMNAMTDILRSVATSSSAVDNRREAASIVRKKRSL